MSLRSPNSRRIAYAVGFSLLLHGLVLWGPQVHLPSLKSPLPPLVAKLEALPTAPKRPKAAKPRQPAAPAAARETPPATPAVEPAPAPQPELAASTPAATEAPAETVSRETLRPPLPKEAQLTFAIHLKRGGMRIGEAVHTLQIEDGRYVLYSVTRTTGLVSLFKTYELTQYSSGSYDRDGLHPEQFFEQRRDKLTTVRQTAELDQAARLIRFSDGGEAALPPDTVDILSVMYQFPPLDGVEVAHVAVTNGRKIEHYAFDIAVDEKTDTPLGTLQTVKLRKQHGPDEEGLEIWLAREYRLFPVKIRFIERNGEVAAEAIITDIRVSEEQGERKDAAD
jgi:hypothetical protein